MSTSTLGFYDEDFQDEDNGSAIMHEEWLDALINEGRGRERYEWFYDHILSSAVGRRTWKKQVLTGIN